MASPCNINTSPDSLQILLQKAHAISTVNQENLDYIQSRKGQQVITKHKYSIQTNPSAVKKQKTEHHTSTDSTKSHSHEMFTLADQKSTKNVDEIISSWRYSRAAALTQEKIAIDHFIDRTLVGYDDLIRLHNDYGKLLKQYTRLLTDEPECRMAVEGVLRNVEVLQVAIGEIHGQTLETVDSDKVNAAMAALKNNLSKAFESFQSEVSGFSINLQSQIGEEQKETSMVEFADFTALKCRHTLSQHRDFIWALESYNVNDETFLVSGGKDKKINVWNLSSNNCVATLTGHADSISALVLYVQNGKYMLASGAEDKTIKLWDLSSYTNVQTLSGHTNIIRSLAVYQKDGKVILISSSWDKTVKLWDLDSYTVITTLQGHTCYYIPLSVYALDERPYLASASFGQIKIWSLDNYSLVQTIDADEYTPIRSLVVVDSNEKKILAFLWLRWKINAVELE